MIGIYYLTQILWVRHVQLNLEWAGGVIVRNLSWVAVRRAAGAITI